MKTVFEKIRENAETFLVPTPTRPTNHGLERAAAFRRVVKEECDELTDCDLEVSLINYADTLGDIIVYCMTEAVRWGIPLEPVLHAIIDSQRSKLVDGKPIWAEDGSKYLKGPNFVPPEPKIAEILLNYQNYQSNELRWGFFMTEEKDFTIHEAIPTDEGEYEVGKMLFSVPTIILARLICDNRNKFINEPR